MAVLAKTKQLFIALPADEVPKSQVQHCVYLMPLYTAEKHKEKKIKRNFYRKETCIYSGFISVIVSLNLSSFKLFNRNSSLREKLFPLKGF